MAAVEQLSHVLREFPILERPGGAPPALVRMTGGGQAQPQAQALPAVAPAGPPGGMPAYGAAPVYAGGAAGGYRPY